MNVGAATFTQVGLGVILFTLIVLVLVAVILAARSRLVAEGTVTVLINRERELQLPVGVKLMNGLADAGIFIPSACGGGGTCGQCTCRVLSGGGAILPTETSLISPREAKEHYRLSCQVAVKQDMEIQIPDEIFGIRSSTILLADAAIQGDDLADCVVHRAVQSSIGRNLSFSVSHCGQRQ